MKTKLILPMVAIAMMMVACTTVYTGVVTITNVVDNAMKAWADLSVKGLTSTAIDSKVVLAHANYQGACGVAQKALIAYKQSGDPAQYQAAIQTAKDAANALLDLIVPLLSPSQGTQLKSQLTNAKTI